MGTDSLQCDRHGGWSLCRGVTADRDLAPYLQDVTRVEADLTVALGAHTSIKVKVKAAGKREGVEERKRPALFAQNTTLFTSSFFLFTFLYFSSFSPLRGARIF